MARRWGGITETQRTIDELLRYHIPFILLLFTLNALRFALAGAPGIGDIAHINAIELPFGHLFHWIAGDADPSLMPAPARSAPLPLLLDWPIWRLQPFGIPGLRIAHLAMALATLTLLLRAIALRMDQRTAIVAGLVIALSPRFIEAVTNLGADPYIFILFCWQLALLIARGRLGGVFPSTSFVVIGAACGLCGIAGIAAATGLFIVLLATAPGRADTLRRMRALAPILPLWIVLIYVQIVTGPLVDGLTSNWLLSVTTKLFVHNADLLLWPGALLLAGGAIALILLGLYSYVGRFRRNGPSERTHPFALLLLATLSGGAAAFVFGPVTRLYDWTEPAAHAWLCLLVTLLAASCFTPRLIGSSADAPRRMRQLAAGAMILGAISGSAAYQYRADWFAAGPEAGLKRALGAAGHDRAIVYAGYDWGRAYFPHHWLVPDDRDQWRLTPDGRTVQHILEGGALSPPQPLSALDRYQRLIVTRVDRRGWRSLYGVANTKAIGALPPAPLTAFRTGWTADPAQAAPGEYWLTTQLLRRHNGSEGPEKSGY